MPRLCTALLLTLFLSLSGFAGTTADLKKGFATPPDSVRPWVYWVWMDGNLTKEGITADLEAMKRAGIGGMILTHLDAERIQLTRLVLPPVWEKHHKDVVKEAERLGLEISLITGPG